MQRPKVGIGVIIENNEGKILIGKRKSTYAPYFSIPGGHLECGETFEEAATREIEEETSLKIFSPKIICVTNNLRTYQESNIHFVSIILHSKDFKGTPIVAEPDKCEGWEWVDPRNLPQPHFDASEFGVKCFLQDIFYLQ